MGLDLEGFAIGPTEVRNPSLTSLFKPFIRKTPSHQTRIWHPEIEEDPFGRKFII